MNVNVLVRVEPETGAVQGVLSDYPNIEGDWFTLFCNGICDAFGQPLDAKLFPDKPSGKRNWKLIVIPSNWFEEPYDASTTLGGYLEMWDKGQVRFDVRYGDSVRKLNRGATHSLSGSL